MSSSAQNLKALVIGSTGAIGQKLAKELVASQSWSEVHVIARKEHESWNSFSQEQRQNLKLLRIKGETELLLQQKKLEYLGIYRPGLLLNSVGERFIETIASYIPFIKKIDVRDVAAAMRIQAEKNYNLQQNTNKTVMFENNDMIKIQKNKK